MYISSEHISLPWWYSRMLALQWLSLYKIKILLLLVTPQVDLPAKQRKLYSVFRACQIKPRFGFVPDTKPQAVFGESDSKDKYEVKYM